MLVPSQESEWLCTCMLGISILLLFNDSSIEFWNCSHSVVFVFHSIGKSANSFHSLKSYHNFVQHVNAILTRLKFVDPRFYQRIMIYDVKKVQTGDEEIYDSMI